MTKILSFVQRSRYTQKKTDRIGRNHRREKDALFSFFNFIKFQFHQWMEVQHHYWIPTFYTQNGYIELYYHVYVEWSLWTFSSYILNAKALATNKKALMITIMMHASPAEA